MQTEVRIMYSLAAAFSLIAPPVLFLFKSRSICRTITALYAFGIIYITIISRLFGIAIGVRSFDPVRQLDLTPFWSYGKFNHADIRWQVYMNVFLFIPFGFMLPWCSERFQKLWKVIVIAAVFSALTEAAQYILRIGLCETDDVIHNTLGAVVGYGYWRLLLKLRTRFRGDGK